MQILHPERLRLLDLLVQPKPSGHPHTPGGVLHRGADLPVAVDRADAASWASGGLGGERQCVGLPVSTSDANHFLVMVLAITDAAAFGATTEILAIARCCGRR